jgi:outer membrane receptor protein involved in Fe transport
MITVRTLLLRYRSLAAAALLAAGAARAQTPSSDGEPVTLSPFVVNAEADTGYVATDSLAGTRLRTPLKDIAASISVVTKDLLDDLAATGTADLLVYTTGTEVVGVGGNFSNSSSDTYNQNFEAQRESSSPSTRVRGLASADQTRNFFSSPHIPLDSYNTQSVTINRGANAVLFGFGSPAGIIENSLIAPQFRNKGQAQVRVGSYGSRRGSFDIERVLIPAKLSLRVAALNDARRYEQDPAFRDQRRLYGAITFRPFQATTVRVNAETGSVDQRLPRVDPPLDSLTTWWDFGQPTRTNLFYGRMPDGTNVTTYQRNNNLDGMAGNWGANPGLIYSSVHDALPSDAYVAYATAPGGIVYRHLGPRSSKEIALFVPGRIDPLAGFQVGRQLLDRSIFDYRKQMIDGPNSGTWLDFDTINVAVEQLFLNGDAGIEFVYDRQETLQRVLRGAISGYRGNNIFIDVDTVTTDGRPNPNFGRPYVATEGAFNREENEIETARVTAFLKHDFRKHGGFFGRLLGVQSLTALYTDYQSERYFMGGPDAVVEPTWRGGTNGNSIGDRNITHVIYLGPSLAGAASPVGARLQGLQTQIRVPDTYPIWVLNPGTSYRWVQQSPRIYSWPDYEHITRTLSFGRNEAESYAAVLQGNWWDNTLVSTLGWREDSVKTASAINNTIDPATGAVRLGRPTLPTGLEVDNSTFTYGLALHVPAKWFSALPGSPRFSLYYNSSENFQLTDARRSIVGAYLEPQAGSTEEFGFGVSGFDNRLNLRATWYETTQDNITDSRLTSVLNRIAVLEASILGNIPKATLDSIGYVGPDNPNTSPLFKQYLDYYGFNMGSVRDDGTIGASYTSNPPGTAEVTSSISKGVEIEVVYNPTRNWRILVNVARQEAVRGDTSPTFSALVEERLAQWKNPLLWPSTIGSWSVESYANTNLVNPLNTAKLSAGEATSELREWRANLVTNYSFNRASRLRGWAVGGAARWQDEVALGYPVIRDPVLGLVTDIHHPFMGDDQITFDGWLSYQRRIFGDKVNWKIQLNVRNLLNDNLMIPVKANPVTEGDLDTFQVAAYRIGAKRTWELSSTFSF